MKKGQGRSWSKVEEEWLAKNHDKMSLNQLSIALSHGIASIKKKLAEIKPDTYEANRVKSGKKVIATVTHIGKRKDLGIFVRSSWEANVARLLNYLKKYEGPMKVVKWEYEPYTFWFEDIKKGNRYYTPDFHVTFASGDYAWIEVKGWLRSGDKTKIKRFKKRYPDEFEHLWVVVSSKKTKAYEFFTMIGIPDERILKYKDLTLEYASSIEHWER